MTTCAVPRVRTKDAQRLLLSKRSEILSRLTGHDDSWSRLGRVADDDLAPVSHEEFVSIEMNRIGFSEFKLVEAALARIESGDYGICLRCDEPISSKRLAAIPWASRCIACEEMVSRETSMAYSEERVA